jgi:hypothetical protein
LSLLKQRRRPADADRSRAAQSWPQPGGRILFIPGGDYPEPVILYKNLIYEAIGYRAVLGD